MLLRSGQELERATHWMLSWPDLNLVSLIPVVFVRACSTSASFGTYPCVPIRLISSKKL
jgi:hypothetical protein